MTASALQQVIDRVMVSLPPEASIPTPSVLQSASQIPAAQRRVHVGRFRYAGVVVAPMAEWVYIYLKPLVADFGEDEAAIEAAVRKTLMEDVAPGFAPVAPKSNPSRSSDEGSS